MAVTGSTPNDDEDDDFSFFLEEMFCEPLGTIWVPDLTGGQVRCLRG